MADISNTETALTENINKGDPSPNRKRKLIDVRSYLSKENNKESEADDDVKRVKQDIDADLFGDYGHNIFTAPQLWTADAMTDGKTLLLHKDKVYIGTLDGRMIIFGQDGTFVKQWKFPDQVGAIFQDGDHLYAWCHPKLSINQWKGSLYEIFEEEVRLLFDLVEFGDMVENASMADGCLALSDNHGSIVVLAVSGELLWHKQETQGHRHLFHADKTGLYTAFKRRVCKYALDTGSLLWEYSLSEGRASTIQGGKVHGPHVFVEINGKIRQFDADSGDVIQDFVPNRQRASGMAVGGGFLLTGTCPTVIFNIEDGNEVYRMNFSGRLDDSVSMITDTRLLYSFWDMLYCVDLSDVAISRAIEGKSRAHKVTKIPEDIEEVQNKEPAKCADLPGCLTVECIEIDGEVVGRTLMNGYDDDKNVALPFGWKELGRSFVVDELEECTLADCYRVKGRTRLVIEEVEVTSPKIKTSRGKPSSDAASRKEERRSRRSSTFVTSLAMQLQPISLEDEDNQDA